MTSCPPIAHRVIPTATVANTNGAQGTRPTITVDKTQVTPTMESDSPTPTRRQPEKRRSSPTNHGLAKQASQTRAPINPRATCTATTTVQISLIGLGNTRSSPYRSRPRLQTSAQSNHRQRYPIRRRRGLRLVRMCLQVRGLFGRSHRPPSPRSPIGRLNRWGGAGRKSSPAQTAMEGNPADAPRLGPTPAPTEAVRPPWIP